MVDFLPMDVKKLKTNSEEDCPRAAEHLVLHRHWRSVVLWFILFGLVSFYGIPISKEFPETVLHQNVDLFGFSFVLHLPILLLVAILVIARPLFLLFDCKYEVKCHHISATTGILSFNKRHFEMPLENARGVEVKQNLWERILFVGTVLVGSAMTDVPEVELHGVADPEGIATIIRSRMDRSIKERKGQERSGGF